MVKATEPYYRRPDLHFVWLGLPFAIVIGAGAWLGVPGVIIPMALLLVAFVSTVLYVHVMIPVPIIAKGFIYALVITLFSALAWAFWFVFAVDMKVRFVTGQDNNGMEELRFAVELTNRGKPTGLTHWRATLIDSSGNTYIGEPVRMVGDSTEIVTGSHVKMLYALPDCDLRVQTAKALQSGDSDYGIADFLFRTYPARTLPMDTRVVLEASDMLGRTISSGKIPFAIVNAQPIEVFPCREVKQQ
jgi:hypothetical protein